MSEIAVYYTKSKNPEEASFPGVPLRSLTADEWERVPAWLQASVLAHPAYRQRQTTAAPSAEGVASGANQADADEADAADEDEVTDGR